MKTPLLLLLRAYKLGVSPFLGQNCRFYPSCSDYAAEAVQTHGALKGSLLAAKRLCKCHPWHEGGLDPVPASRAASGNSGNSGAAGAGSARSQSSASSSSALSSSTATVDGCSHS
ncbi:membrane protein insertion efficiency factor YidD [Herbaspirillum lusitanum]|uniref:Putative membrane protein insertion efficiency factor n=1 Tax=Herbaspirillum lusitanum TaxID=213312 RepID=A0ABW9A700_9BURK